MTATLRKTTWGTVPLAEIAEIEREAVAPDHIAAGSKYVGLENISSSGRIEKYTEVTAGCIASTKFRFTADHVLYGKLRPYLSKIALPNFAGVCSTDILPILPKRHIDRRFLYYFLRQPQIVELAARQSTGANLPRLSPKRLAEFQIPLPPLSEQKRIADILDKADAIRRKRQAFAPQCNHFIRSTFCDLFGDPTSNSKSWAKLKLGNLLHGIDSGWSPTCLDEKARPNEWGVLKLGAVTTCKYLDSENKSLPPNEVPRPGLEVKRGDLLMSRKNTYELVAATAYVYDTRPHLMIPDLVFRFQISRTDLVLPQYLWGLFTEPVKRRQIQRLASGSSGSMPNISKARLNTLDIEVPPIEVQQKFSNIVDSVYRSTTKSDFLQRQANELFNSLVQRACKEEL